MSTPNITDTFNLAARDLVVARQKLATAEAAFEAADKTFREALAAKSEAQHRFDKAISDGLDELAASQQAAE